MCLNVLLIAESMNLSEAGNLEICCLMDLSWPLLYIYSWFKKSSKKKKEVILDFK